MNVLSGTILASFLMLDALPAQALSPSLLKTHEWVVHKYKKVKHINIETFIQMQIETPQSILVFDVRRLEEFSVSHIDGAIHLNPKIRRADFLRIYRDEIRGKNIVLYCSAGYRSSRLAGKLQDELLQNGASGVYNLRGGLFAWHNQNLGLVNSAGTTDFIHPYNKEWQSLVVRSEKISYISFK